MGRGENPFLVTRGRAVRLIEIPDTKLWLRGKSLTSNPISLAGNFLEGRQVGSKAVVTSRMEKTRQRRRGRQGVINATGTLSRSRVGNWKEEAKLETVSLNAGCEHFS
jgi:hypothetical protein